MKLRLAWVGLLVISAVLYLTSNAGARLVPIGRYVEIPFGTPTQHPYATEGANPHRSSASRYRVGEAPTQRVWEARVPVVRAYAPVVLDDGTLYVAGTTGLASLSPSGELVFSLSLGFATGTPSIGPGNVIVLGNQAGELITVSSTGEVLHRARVGGALRGSPLVLPDGSIVGPAADHALHRVDEEGRPLFRVSLGAPPVSAAAWSPSQLIVAAVGHAVFVSSSRGDVVARVDLPQAITVGPVIGGDSTIWIVTADRKVYLLEGRGRIRAEVPIPDRVTHIVVGPDGAARLLGREAEIICVEPSGEVRWRITDLGAFPAGGAIDADNVLLALNQRGELFAIDGGGVLRWQFDTGQRSSAPPVLGADGTIYTITQGAVVTAYR